MKIIRFLLPAFILLFISGISDAQTGVTPDQAPKIAEIAVDVVKQVDGYQLDYSPESLQTVDKIALKLHEEGKTPQSIPKTILVLGCYVGEVMVRNLGYKWEMPTEKEKELGFEMVGIRDRKGSFLNPIGKVYKRVQNGSEDSVVMLYDFSREFSAIIEEEAKNE